MPLHDREGTEVKLQCIRKWALEEGHHYTAAGLHLENTQLHCTECWVGLEASRSTA